MRRIGTFFPAELNRGFARSLKNGGVLFIGSTESLLDAQALGLKRMFASFFCKEGSIKTPESAAGTRFKNPTVRV